RASAERTAELEVGDGPARKKIILWLISGLGNSPAPIWATEDGHFFGADLGLAILPAGYESALDAIDKAQDQAIAARSPALVKALLKPPPGPVAFTHVRAFVGGRRFVEDETVVVDKGIITEVGPSATTRAPSGAQVIDGAGKTLVPGLWDSHMHF